MFSLVFNEFFIKLHLHIPPGFCLAELEFMVLRFQRMKSEYKCEVELGKPKVAFRECIVSDIKYDLCLSLIHI